MSHKNTLFGQLLQEFSRYDFEKLVTETKSEKSSKGFSSWNHFTALLYGQLSRKDNLRGIENGLIIESNKLYHLGIAPIKRSTLAYANNHRPNELFEKIFYQTLQKVMQHAPQHKFKFKNPLYSIDATTIDLCLSLHDWAKFRKTKGGIKLHMRLNHQGYIPDFCILSEANCHEKNYLNQYPQKPGDIVVFDRGYNDYKQFYSLNKGKIFFVTRLKKNAKYSTVSEFRTKSKNILSDEIIKFDGYYAKQDYPAKLRIIKSKDSETGKTINILTNNMKLSANTISKIYKDRWKIEIFFKTIKQNLKIKSFIGTSKNAILSQVWVALITYLLLSYLRFKSKHNWSIHRLSEAFQGSLFARRNLWEWLDNPFSKKKGKSPPDKISGYQMELGF